MKALTEHKISGIYAIRNRIDGKMYIGKAYDIHRRIIEHVHKLTKKDKNENPYLTNAWHKYGKLNFEYFVVEACAGEEEVAKRELYWMKVFDTLNHQKGYNLRSDSDSKMIVHELTRKKISERLKKEWKDGIRAEHSLKLSKNWKSTPERKRQQAKLMTGILTKWCYKVNDEILSYQELVEKGYKNVIATFHKKKSNIVKFKGQLIERVMINDIVRSSQKCEKNKSNSYIAINTAGKAKCKGRFEYENLALHKNKSHLIIPKALYAYFIEDKLPEQFLQENRNIFDYCAGVKIKGDWEFQQLCVINGEITRQSLQKTLRYYISKKGCKIYKVNKSDKREIQLESGKWMQQLFNLYEEKPWAEYEVDESYYLDKIYKEINNIIPRNNQLTLF